MGFNDKERFIYLLEGGDVQVNGNTGLPMQLAPYGPWTSAFPDQVQRKFASEGIAQIIRNTQMDPDGVNYADFMRAVYSTITKPEHYIEGTVHQSGSRSLHIKNVTAPTDRDFRGPVFRIGESNTYRISVRWRSSGSDVSLITFGVDCYDEDFVFVGSEFTGLLTGTGGNWQWDAVVLVVPAGARFGVARANRPGTTARGDVYLDQFLIQPIGGMLHRTTNAGQAINEGGSGDTVAFEDAGVTEDDDVSYAAGGTFTILRPGDYQVNASILFTGLADTVRHQVAIAVNDVRTYWGGPQTQSGANIGGASVGATIRCARGDTLKIIAFWTAGGAGTEALHADGAFNWVTIKRLD